MLVSVERSGMNGVQDCSFKYHKASGKPGIITVNLPLHSFNISTNDTWIVLMCSPPFVWVPWIFPGTFCGFRSIGKEGCFQLGPVISLLHWLPRNDTWHEHGRYQISHNSQTMDGLSDICGETTTFEASLVSTIGYFVSDDHGAVDSWKRGTVF